MGATFSMVKTVNTDDDILAADWMAEFQNILNNLDPTGIDDESANDAAARATSDPYSGGSLVKATSLEKEIQQLRYLITQITGETYWYIDPRDTIWISASAMTPLSTNGAAAGVNEYATNDVMIDYCAFDGATEEYVAVNIVMPENWDRATIRAKFFWAPGDAACTAADTVEWQIQGISITDDDAIDTAYTDAGEVISDAVTAGKNADLHVTSATPVVTINGSPGLNHFINLKISRNVGGTDDMTEDAWLFGVLIEYTMTQTSAAWS